MIPDELRDERGRIKRQHGMSGTPEMNVWGGIVARCTRPWNIRWKDYGGRGIRVEWKTVEEFYADMGPRPAGTTIDRIDVDGNYCKENCRWADRLTQANNTRNNVYLTYGGETLSVSEWARRKGFKVAMLHWRVRQGWSAERCIEQPLRSKVALRGDA